MIKELGPNGTLPIQLGWKHAGLKLEFVGGPYDHYPSFYDDDTFGVCVRSERVPKGGYDVHLPIRDFSIPDHPAPVANALMATLVAAMDGRRVYVGCMGGWGRTGLFLALLAKAAGVEDPIGYVRTHYTPRAVETDAQERFVKTFDVSEIQQKLVGRAWKARLRRLFGR